MARILDDFHSARAHQLIQGGQTGGVNVEKTACNDGNALFLCQLIPPNTVKQDISGVHDSLQSVKSPITNSIAQFLCEQHVLVQPLQKLLLGRLVTIDEILQKRHHQESNNVDDLDQRVDRRTSRILIRIAYRVARDCSFVGV